MARRNSDETGQPASGPIESRGVDGDSDSGSDPLDMYSAYLAQPIIQDDDTEESRPNGNTRRKANFDRRRGIEIDESPARIGKRKALQSSSSDFFVHSSRSKTISSLLNGTTKTRPVSGDSDPNALSKKFLENSQSDLSMGQSRPKSDTSITPITSSSGPITSRPVGSHSGSGSDEEFTALMKENIELEKQHREANKGKIKPKPFVPRGRGIEEDDQVETRDEEALKALKWRPKSKRPPEHMTAAEAAQQKKYNPLIKLLGINIKIVRSDDDEDPSISDSASSSGSANSKPMGDTSEVQEVGKLEETSPRLQNSELQDLSEATDEDHELSPTECDSDSIKLDDEISSTGSEGQPSKELLVKDYESRTLTDTTEAKSASFNPLPQEPDSPDHLPTAGINHVVPSSKDSRAKYSKSRTLTVTRENNGSLCNPQCQQSDDDDELSTTGSEDEAPRTQSQAKNARRGSPNAPVQKRPAEDLFPPIPSKKPKQQVTYPRKQLESRPNLMIISEEQDAEPPLILSPSVKLTASINKFLKPYQRDGVKFFFQHYQQKNGVVLGDDMGLGKTIQVIAFLSAVMGLQGTPDEQNRRKKVINKLPKGQSYKPSKLGPTCLVICPKTVIDNWAREIETWGYFEYATLTSTTTGAQTLSRFNVGAFDILICGFTYARDHIDELYDLDFTIVVVDEAHNLKNRKSAMACAFRRFKTKIRFGLTGTAMQNNLSELHSLFDWVRPGALGTEVMWDAFVANPLLQARKSDASSYEMELGDQRAQALVQKCWPDLQLRRTKSEILHELPPRTDHVALCPMTATQKLAHANLLSDPDVVNMRKNALPCPCGKKNNQGQRFPLGRCCDQGWQKRTFPYLILFGKIVNHLALAFPNRQDKPEKYEQDKIYMEKMFPNDTWPRDRHFSSKYDEELCGKWKVLKPLLEQWKRSQFKVLLFSQSTKMMDIIEYWLQQDFPEFVRLDGSVATKERYKRVEEFQTDPNKFIFLASVKAAGVGLNLTAANKVVIFDPSWNPSQDAQAMDRVVRIGQKRAVECIRLISSGTTEELVYHRQLYKQGLSEVANTGKATSRHFTGVQGDKNNQGDIFGAKNLFKTQVNEGCNPNPEENVDDFSYVFEQFVNHGSIVADGKNKDEFEMIPLEELPHSAPCDPNSAEALLRDFGAEGILRNGEIVKAALPPTVPPTKVAQASNMPRPSMRSAITQPPLRGAKLKAKIEKKKKRETSLGNDAAHPSSAGNDPSHANSIVSKDFGARMHP